MSAKPICDTQQFPGQESKLWKTTSSAHNLALPHFIAYSSTYSCSSHSPSNIPTIPSPPSPPRLSSATTPSTNHQDDALWKTINNKNSSKKKGRTRGLETAKLSPFPARPPRRKARPRMCDLIPRPPGHLFDGIFFWEGGFMSGFVNVGVGAGT